MPSPIFSAEVRRDCEDEGCANKLTAVQRRIAQILEEKRVGQAQLERDREVAGGGHAPTRRQIHVGQGSEGLMGCDFERNGSVYKACDEVALYGNSKTWLRMQGTSTRSSRISWRAKEKGGRGDSPGPAPRDRDRLRIV